MNQSTCPSCGFDISAGPFTTLFPLSKEELAELKKLLTHDMAVEDPTQAPIWEEQLRKWEQNAVQLPTPEELAEVRKPKKVYIYWDGTNWRGPIASLDAAKQAGSGEFDSVWVWVTNDDAEKIRCKMTESEIWHHGLNRPDEPATSEDSSDASPLTNDDQQVSIPATVPAPPPVFPPTLPSDDRAKELELQMRLAKEAEARRQQAKKNKRRHLTIAIAAVLLVALVAGIIAVPLGKLTTSTYRSKSLSESFFDNAKQGDTFLLGKYEQDNNTENGNEDIEWVVLKAEDNLLLAISKYCLDNIPYNDTDDYVETDWERCTLRQWLNHDFYDSAFSGSEKSWICDANISNYDGLGYAQPGGNNTVDCVSLLSCHDIETIYADYEFTLASIAFGDEADTRILFNTASEFGPLATTYTEYAKETYIQAQLKSWNNKTEEEIRAQYRELEDQYGKNASCWWLRTRGEKKYNTMEIVWDGGALASPSQVHSIGIRPVIIVSKYGAPATTPSQRQEDEALDLAESVNQANDGQLQSNTNVMAAQMFFDEQQMLCTTNAGEVLRLAHFGCKVFDWPAMVKVVSGGTVTVGLTSDGKVLLEAERENPYGTDQLFSIEKKIVDVCICSQATNPKDETQKGCIIALADDGTAYFTYAGGYGVAYGGIKGIAADDTKYAVLLENGNVDGEKFGDADFSDVLTWSDITEVVCGEYFIAGLKADGTVVVSGDCMHPAIKTDMFNDESIGIDGSSLTITSEWTNIVSIAAGCRHLVGLKQDGTVLSAGYNSYGQCDTTEWIGVVHIDASGNDTVGYCANEVWITGKDIALNVANLRGKYSAFVR